MLKDVVVDGVVMGQVDVPDGYEVVSWRPPVVGEVFLRSDGTLHTSDYTYCENEKRWILRKQFVWPDWITPGVWYARDKSGAEFLYVKEPHRQGVDWSAEDPCLCRVNRKLFTFPDVPPCDWSHSKMQKPLETAK